MNIRDKIDCIFDVGCRTDSEFVNFTGEVHYFDPVSEFIEELKKNKNGNNVNKKAYFNNFGLGEENKQTYYYPKYQSFMIERIAVILAMMPIRFYWILKLARII
jgi:hypothetical protein